MQFILRRFEDIMQSEHKSAVQQLPEDVLLDIIRDNNLEAGSETNVLLVRLSAADLVSVSCLAQQISPQP